MNMEKTVPILIAAVCDAREELKNMLDFPIEFASNTED